MRFLLDHREAQGTAASLVEMGHVVPAPERAGLDKVCEVAIAAARAAGLTVGPIHVEVVTTSAGPSVIELAGRLGGDQITTLIRLALGVDLHRMAIRQAMREQLCDPPGKGHGGAAIRFLTAPPGLLESIDGLDEAKKLEGIYDASVTACVGATIEPLRSSSDRLGHVIAVGATPAQARERAWHAAKGITINVQSKQVAP